MANHGVIKRWPKAECLHQDAEKIELRNGAGTLIRTNERCFDCGARRPEGGEWK